MTVQAMGYFWVGTSKLDDWTSFAIGQLGLQAVDRGGAMRAFRMDDRKQRLIVDGGLRRAFFRLGGCGRDGARCASGAVGKCRRRGAAGDRHRGGPTMRR